MLSHIKDKTMLLVTGDFVVMVVASLCALALGHRGAFSFRLVRQYSWSLLTLIMLVIIIFFILDFYSMHKALWGKLQKALVILTGLALSSIVGTVTFFFLRNAVPRGVFLLFYLFTAILILGLRYLLSKMIKPPLWRVLVIGNSEHCKNIAEMLHSKEYLRSQVIGFLSDIHWSQEYTDCTHLGNVSELSSVIDQYDVAHVIVATTGSVSYELAHLLTKCMRAKVRVSGFSQVMEDLSGQIPIDYLDDYWFIVELGNQDKRYFWYAKRYIDIGIALTGIILAFPLFLVAALMIKLESSGPIFYTQQRIGRNNKPFKAWKLRTMIDGADKNNVHWTLEKDNRITRVGKLLRKLRFDETPQLINMLRGEMSLIGPRPEAISLVEQYTEAIPYYLERHMVAPGITGWAQINYRYGNSIEDTRQKLMFDLFYIKNRNAMLDTTIFLRTIHTVLTGKGAM